MNADYYDIRSRLGRPLWFDENAVPRYREFHPNWLANIYADEAALFLIRCQTCKQEFIVAASNRQPTIGDMIGKRELDFGDPPNVGCNEAHVSSMPTRVLQYWRRRVHASGWLQDVVAELGADPSGWWRDPSLEVDIRPDWVLEVERQLPWPNPNPPNSECGGLPLEPSD